MCAGRPATAVAPVVKSSEYHHGHVPVTDKFFPDTGDGCTTGAIKRRRRGPRVWLTGRIRPIGMWTR